MVSGRSFYPRDWQDKVRAKLIELLGYDRSDSGPVARHVKDIPLPGGLRRRRVYLKVRDYLDIPIHLVWRDKDDGPKPVLLYMAGSTSGVHVGWGDALIPADYLLLGVGADMARQAAERGYPYPDPGPLPFGGAGHGRLLSH